MLTLPEKGERIAKRMADLVRRPSLTYVRKMGFACGLFGANQQTCDFRLFWTAAHTAAWQEAKRAAEAAKATTTEGTENTEEIDEF